MISELQSITEDVKDTIEHYWRKIRRILFRSNDANISSNTWKENAVCITVAFIKFKIHYSSVCLVSRLALYISNLLVLYSTVVIQ